MKRMYGLIIILLVFLGFAFVQEQPGRQQSASATKETKTVGLLQLMSHPALDEIHQGIVAGLKSSGYVQGKNLKLDFENAQGDQSNLKSMSTKFGNENVDAAIGITTPDVQSLANTLGKTTPIVMGAVDDPVAVGLMKNPKHPGGNITGVSGQSPVDQDLALIKDFVPNLKTLGMMYTSSDTAAIAQAKKFKKYCEEQHIKLKVYTVANSNDVDQVSQTMVANVDAVYIPSDNTIASAMTTVAKNANAVKVPLFPSADTMVKQGGLATYAISQYGMGYHAGKIAAQILNGKNPADIPVFSYKKGIPTLNLKQAKLLGIKVPADFLKDAQENGEVIK